MKYLLILLLIMFSFPTYADESSVYDRVMKSGKIICGYGIYDPSLIKNPNTGEFSGIFYEVTNELGRRLGLEIEWAEETGYGVIAEGFRTNRFDVFVQPFIQHQIV